MLGFVEVDGIIEHDGEWRVWVVQSGQVIDSGKAPGPSEAEKLMKERYGFTATIRIKIS